jgi:hypothetical protein
MAINPVIITEENGRRIIVGRGASPQHSQLWLAAIQEAIVDGYRLPEKPDRQNISSRLWRGVEGRAVLYKEVVSKGDTTPEVVVVAEVVAETVAAEVVPATPEEVKVEEAPKTETKPAEKPATKKKPASTNKKSK